MVEKRLIIQSSGKSFTEARDDANRKSSMPIYLGACRILIFTDRLASLGLEEYLNRSRAQHDTRKSLKIITSSNEPEDILTAETDNSKSVGLSIDNMIENMANDGYSFKVDIGDLLEALAVKQVGFLIPEIAIENSHLTLTGYTVFKNAKKIGFIPAGKRNGVVCFLNPNACFDYEIYNNAQKFEMETKLKNKKIKTSYNNGQLDIKIQMNFTAELNYSDTLIPLKDTDKDKLQNMLADRIKQDILEAVETSQKEYGVYYLEIYRYFKAEHNSDFKHIDWEKIYADSTVEVETKVIFLHSDIPLI
jgi:Ger(x)C family germination protein